MATTKKPEEGSDPNKTGAAEVSGAGGGASGGANASAEGGAGGGGTAQDAKPKSEGSGLTDAPSSGGVFANWPGQWPPEPMPIPDKIAKAEPSELRDIYVLGAETEACLRAVLEHKPGGVQVPVAANVEGGIRDHVKAQAQRINALARSFVDE